jgi:prevent-host-death family protein
MIPKLKTVAVTKARTEFETLLKQVAKGGEVVITKRGTPIARLVPPLVSNKGSKDVFDRIRAFHGRIVLPKGETAKDLIIAGRR